MTMPAIVAAVVLVPVNGADTRILRNFTQGGPRPRQEDASSPPSVHHHEDLALHSVLPGYCCSTLSCRKMRGCGRGADPKLSRSTRPITTADKRFNTCSTNS
ncbi:hypothetical protein B0H63DRAFT_87181 [Podospora didyma]|uniref:Uncharacterized protein n=1 Tax=Podospora didyma TaxID=330526 RepID=A0AAE0K0K5_9PEZI|nr:hypothetical protein B0H63DRAFT_87181 [Podospora didyma]